MGNDGGGHWLREFKDEVLSDHTQTAAAALAFHALFGALPALAAAAALLGLLVDLETLRQPVGADAGACGARPNCCAGRSFCCCGSTSARWPSSRERSSTRCASSGRAAARTR